MREYYHSVSMDPLALAEGEYQQEAPLPSKFILPIQLGLFMALLCLSTPATAAYLSPLRQSAAQLYDQQSYAQAVQTQVQLAQDYLLRRLNHAAVNQQFALVLDIDETALSNLNHLQRHHFSTNMEAFAGAYMLGDAPAISAILALSHYAQRQGVALFFISNRPNTLEVMAATVKNLHQAGYQNWQEIYLRPLTNDQLSTANYKKAMREKITNQGYEIILNIGDQKSDLEGGFAEVAIKLPNPFYQRLD